MNRRTKIVATLGPASEAEPTLERMLRAGVDVIRLNFSHGDHAEHAARVALVRKVSQRLNTPVMLLQDLQGPKIRTGKLVSDPIQLIPGQAFTLTTKPVAGNDQMVSVDYPDLPNSIRPGSRILLDDGKLELTAVGVDEDQIETKVLIGGSLGSRKGVNLPGAKLAFTALTDKDKSDLAFGLELELDAVALSFVRSASDVNRLRKAIGQLAPDRKDTLVIAKLERPEALDNLHAILEAADGVMVARGDLGVEMSPEAVPIAQKQIIDAANQHARIVITATQMLDSMMVNPRPTRAEASDVANAIFDGTDAVMLSGETAAGMYPLQSVEMMNAIIQKAEQHTDFWGHCRDLSASETYHDDTYYMTLAARELAHDRNVAAIAAFTKSGRTALLLSKSRPNVPILAFTPEERTYHRLCLYWGVVPHLVPQVSSIEAMLKVVEAAMMTSTSIQPGQQVVLVCGYPVNVAGPANLALLHSVEERF